MAKESKHLEIERRWLLKRLPPLEILQRPDTEYADITTIYIVSDEQLEVRIRERKDRLGNVTFPVVMKLGQGLARQETPKLLADEFTFLTYHNRKDYDRENLLPRSGENYWKICLANGKKIEIKRLKGLPELCGLTLAEMEFDSEKEAKQFNEQDFPDWFKPLIVKEVTIDPRYNGKNLAVHGRPNPV